MYKIFLIKNLYFWCSLVRLKYFKDENLLDKLFEIKNVGRKYWINDIERT